MPKKHSSTPDFVTAPLPLAERFAALDFTAVPYQDQTQDGPKSRYQLVFVDRQRGYAQMNGVRLLGPVDADQRRMAWMVLKTWAEEVALGRMHGTDNVRDVERHHDGGLIGCPLCDDFFRWVKTGGFGEEPPPVVQKGAL